VLDPDGGAADGPVLVLRPRRVLVAAWTGAVAMVVAFAVIGALLRTVDTGVYFRTADQVALVLLGVLIAAGILLLARPRVRADARGVEVRNVGVPRYIPWHLVRAVAFPDGASWGRLDLPDDEYLPMLAVQAVDGQRAVAAMRQLRALHGAALAATAAGPDGATDGAEPPAVDPAAGAGDPDPRPGGNGGPGGHGPQRP
jgi:hypothetical protein